MPSSYEHAAKLSGSASEDAHLDALSHPDPNGHGLLNLMRAIQQHEREEAGTIETYARIGQETQDPSIAVVMQLLVEDEERHHALMERIAKSLLDRFNWETQSSALPFATPATRHPDSAGALLVNGLIEGELRGAGALRELAAQQGACDLGLPKLLLEAMATDSEKHARLLGFVAERLAPRGQSR